jgi:hypothetical protein
LNDQVSNLSAENVTLTTKIGVLNNEMSHLNETVKNLMQSNAGIYEILFFETLKH